MMLNWTFLNRSQCNALCFLRSRSLMTWSWTALNWSPHAVFLCFSYRCQLPRICFVWDVTSMSTIVALKWLVKGSGLHWIVKITVETSLYLCVCVCVCVLLNCLTCTRMVTNNRFTCTCVQVMWSLVNSCCRLSWSVVLEESCLIFPFSGVSTLQWWDVVTAIAASSCLCVCVCVCVCVHIYLSVCGVGYSHSCSYWIM